MRRLISTRVTLGAKLGAVIGLCVVVTMGLAAVFFSHQAQIAAEAIARDTAQEEAATLVQRIGSEIREPIRAVPATNDALLTLWQRGVRDRRIADILIAHMIEGRKGVFGAWTVWKPNAFDGKDKDFANSPGSDASGRYLTMWRRADAGDRTASKGAVTGADDPAAPIYRVPLDTGAAFASEPYYIMDDSGGHTAVLSYSEPIAVEGKVLGALGIDLAMAPLQELIDKLPRPQDSTFTLVSNRGTVVATNRADLADTSMMEQKSGLTAEFERAHNVDALATMLTGPKGNYLRVWRPISFAGLATPWFVMAEIPVRAFEKDAFRKEVPTIIAALAILLLMLAVILLATRALVTKPLARVQGYIRDLRDGDAAAWPDAGRGDEIGAITKTLAAFQRSEHEVDRLKATETERETRFAAARHQELHELADRLAHSVQAVARAVEGTSQTIMRQAETVAASAVESAEKAKVIVEASVAAGHSVDAVDEAAIALNRSIGTITAEVSHAQKIAAVAAERARTSTEVTNELSNQAMQIGEVVAMISTIAQRTNMLALNATIEAARAGESGRGFAVVAQEVKALAAQTSAATSDIEHQIKTMQAAAKEAAQALVAIGETVEEINAISSAIAGSVDQQADATTRIGHSVGSAVAASSRVDKAICDVDRSTLETGAAAAQMLSEIGKLAEESARLDKEVRNAITQIRVA